MPPKADPYATRGAWTVDAALVFFAVAMIVMVVCTAPRFRRGAHPATRPGTSEVAPALATETSASTHLGLAAVPGSSEP